MKNQTTTTAQTDLYEVAEKAVYIALRARHEKSGLQFLTDLQNAQHTDRRARQAPQTAERIAKLEEQHTATIEKIVFYTARSKRLTLTDSERIQALQALHEHRKTAKRLTAELRTLEKSLDVTYTDRADLTQTALVKLLELQQEPTEITDNILNKYTEEHSTTAEELTAEQWEELQSIANFKAVINAVGKAINHLSSPEAYNSTKTKIQPITAEEVAEYIKTYGEQVLDGYKIPVPVSRIRLSDCYITIEERHTKTQQGYYKVTHYHTTAPYQYIEDFTEDENGESDAQYIKTYNPFCHNTADIADLESLAEVLTAKERQILFDFAKYYGRGADRRTAMLKAYRNNGVKAESTAYRHWSRLTAQLTERAEQLNIIKK